MTPNIKNAYGEKFESQLRRALSGYAPWKTGEMFRQKAMSNKAATQNQMDLLKKLNVKEIPLNSWDASRLIDAAIGEK